MLRDEAAPAYNPANHHAHPVSARRVSRLQPRGPHSCKLPVAHGLYGARSPANGRANASTCAVRRVRQFKGSNGSAVVSNRRATSHRKRRTTGDLTVRQQQQ
ncbi:hypothetical protein HPB50_007674 [Hyalomma asiaticum]|uniref:Uncharacterized protein n=1 Tax=Hyalomma asiaticum TaxID=266040 RepID=A0ACB7SLS7_HYAAI|nr:hypothetical protein HPB50_007674 [Hyalomma asiaticum]